MMTWQKDNISLISLHKCPKISLKTQQNNSCNFQTQKIDFNSIGVDASVDVTEINNKKFTLYTKYN